MWYTEPMKNDTFTTTRTTETVTISSAEYERLSHLEQENEWLNGRVRRLEEQLKVLAKNHFGSKHESASEEVIGQMRRKSMLIWKNWSRSNGKLRSESPLKRRNGYLCWTRFRKTAK